MSSARSPLQLDFVPPRRINSILGLAHAAALGALWLCQLPTWFVVLLTGLLGLSWLYYWLRLGYRFSPWYIMRLTGTPTTGWQLQTGRGKLLPAQLRTFYLHPMLVVLWFDVGGWHRCSVLASADSIGADALRRLRTILLDAPKPLL